MEIGPDELSQQYRSVVESESAELLTFAWAGGERPDTAYYFRVSTEGLLVESDNAVATGQHMHAVWRDLENDLGRNVLLDHYAHNDHRRGAAHLKRRITSSTEADADFIAARRSDPGAPQETHTT